MATLSTGGNHCKYSSVFINSAFRSSGTINNFVINFADGTIKADKGTVIKCNVMDLCLNSSWWSTQKPVTFNVYQNGLIYTNGYLPEGNYDVYTFLDAFSLYLPGWTVAYMALTNTYQFVTPNDPNNYQIKFDNYWTMWGFPNGQTPIMTYGMITMSTIPVLMMQENSLLIHSNLPRLRMGSVDNLGTNVLQESDCIAKIDLSGFGPYDNIVYNEQSDSHFTFYLSVSQLQSMSIYITDQNNKPIPLNIDWTMSIKFIYEDVVTEQENSDHNIKLLEEIRDLIKYVVVSKHIQ